MSKGLEALIDGFVASEMEEKPVWATRLGIDGHDDRLGEFSAADFERRDRQDEAWLAAFSELGDDGLSFDDRIDRDLVVSRLRARRSMRSWQAWRRDPAIYVEPVLSGVLHVFLHGVGTDVQRARHAVARLRAIPGVLASARANLVADLASPVLLRRAAKACRGAVVYVRDVVWAHVCDLEARSAVAEAGKEAAIALEAFVAYLSDMAEVATGSYALGEQFYSALLVDNELLGYGAAELAAKGRAAYQALGEEMAELAQRMAATADWRAAVGALKQDHPATPEAMLEAYARCTERARRFVVEAGLAGVPDDERCLVDPAPHFRRSQLAVPFYEPPQAFKPGRTGHFFVPFPPDVTPPEEVQRRLEADYFASVPTTTAHETYPGHHWHHVVLQDHPRPLRRVLWTSFFVEGWALYAEKLMREQGFFADPAQELAHLNARIFRAARIVVDTGLHAGEMSVDEAERFMMTNASLAEPTARVEVERYCAWPTQAASYLTGALEIERIRSRYLDEGRGDLRSFHDTLAGSGSLPIALAERAVMGDSDGTGAGLGGRHAAHGVGT